MARGRHIRFKVQFRLLGLGARQLNLLAHCVFSGDRLAFIGLHAHRLLGLLEDPFRAPVFTAKFQHLVLFFEVWDNTLVVLNSLAVSSLSGGCSDRVAPIEDVDLVLGFDLGAPWC